MRRALPVFALLVPLLAAVSSVEARGVTVYIQRVLVADPGDIRLGDLVHASGDAPLASGETLAQNLATISKAILYIPSRFYMDRLEDAFGIDSIFVGSRSLVIPRGVVPDNQVAILDKFVDFLGESGVLGNDLLDIDLRSIQSSAALPPDAVPSFQLVRSSPGSVEATFSAPGEAGPVSGRIILAMKPDPRSTVADIKASDPVRVIFHKGPITIEMPGKALGKAAIGQPVSVLVTESRRSFTGTLLAGKAVDVELP
jgi:Chaperone for flagella basal body P-ring formation